jgi:proline racemase
MRTDIQIEAVETHTAGEPTRIVTGGLNLDVRSADDVCSSRRAFAEEYDWIRELLVKEPRGHADMFGAVPVPTTADDHADFGLFFFDTEGYLEMCGHGTVGAVTALVETGELSVQESYTIETPAGPVRARPRVRDGTVESVTVENVPSFVVGTTDLRLDGEPIAVDVVYAGNLCALVDVEQLDFDVDTASVDRAVERGLELKTRLNDRLDVRHTVTEQPLSVSVVEFYQQREGTDRNVVVFADGSVDRSPCGTGTCAKVTLLHDEGELSVGTTYRYESVIGTEFLGRVREVERRGDLTLTHPEVTGSAYVTGKHTFVRDPADDLGGFSLVE